MRGGTTLPSTLAARRNLCADGEMSAGAPRAGDKRAAARDRRADARRHPAAHREQDAKGRRAAADESGMVGDIRRADPRGERRAKGPLPASDAPRDQRRAV